MDNNYEEESKNQEPLNTLTRVINIFTDPKRAFESLIDHPKFFGVYIIGVLISSLVLLWNYFDGSTEKMMIDQLVTTGQPITEQILSISMMIALFGGILLFMAAPFILAFIYHILVMINSETGYKKTLAITTHATMISSLNTLITVLILKSTGVTLQFSPVMFMDASNNGSIIYTLLSYLNIFIIWKMIVYIIGFKTIHKMPTKNAVIVTIAPSLVVLLISLIYLVATT